MQRLLKKVRTAVVKHDTNPVFNKTIYFDTEGTSVDELTLTVKLKNSVSLGRDRAFAMLEVGQDVTGSGGQQWVDVMESAETGKLLSIERWHCLQPINTAED